MASTRRSWVRGLLVCACASCLAVGMLAQEIKPQPKEALLKAANFTLEDLEGRPWTLHNLKDYRAVVLYFTATECPLANRYIARVNQLAARYARKPVLVVAINPNGLESVAHIAKHAKDTGLLVNVLLDRDQKVADQLKVEVTPTAIVLDDQWQVRYRGLFDDSHIEGHVRKHYVRDAIEALLAGQEVKEPETDAWGCMVQRAEKVTGTDVTYAEHVAPLLRKHCVSCHRPDGDAPMAFSSYEEARRWGRTMAAFTQKRRMPPWKPTNGPVFHDARGLSAAELQTLQRWVSNGSPAGDLQSVPPLPQFADGWALAKPDLVLSAPEYELPPHGDDQFRCFVLPTGLPQDVWLRAVEVRPGNRRAAHHVLVYVDATGGSEKLAGAATGPGYPSTGVSPGFAGAEEVASWAPGKTLVPLPDKVGMRLPKGARLVLLVHYHPTGRPEKDRTQVGLSFAAQVDKPLRSLEVANRSFEIPAGARRHTVTAEHVLKDGIEVLAIRPQMHYLGRAMTIRAALPDKTSRELFRVDNWDFHWQETYRFKTPVTLPKGTRLVVEAHYDNSADNPYNPNILPRAVGPGDKMTDEQCAAWLFYTDKQK